MQVKVVCSVLFMLCFMELISGQTITFQNMQTWRSRNYQLPIDAKLSLKNKFSINTGDTDFFTYQVQLTGIHLDTLFILDAHSKAGYVLWKNVRRIEPKKHPWIIPVLLGTTALVVTSYAILSRPYEASSPLAGNTKFVFDAILGLTGFGIVNALILHDKHRFTPEEYYVFSTDQ